MAIFGPTTTTAVVSGSTAEVYTPTSGGTARDVTLINTGGANVFVGQSTVTATTGLKVPPGGQLTLQAVEEAIYAIAASTTSSTVESGLATVASVV